MSKITTIVAVGAGAAIIAGAGTAAVAQSGSGSPSGSPTTTSGNAQHKADRQQAFRLLRKALRRTVQADVVTRGPNGTFVTHQIIRGTVTSVSSTGLTVKAADGNSEHYALAATTKIRLRSDGSAKAGTAADLHTGDLAWVNGTGTPTPTAKRVVDVGSR